MRKPICWIERIEEGVRREVRVSTRGGALRWQSKRSDQEAWVYDFEPTEEDWAALHARAEAWYRRRQLPYKEFEMIARRGR